MFASIHAAKTSGIQRNAKPGTIRLSKTEVVQLKQTLLEKGRQALSDVQYVQKIRLAGAQAAEFLIEAMKFPLTREARDIPFAAAELAKQAADSDSSAITAFIRALEKKEAPVGLLLEIIECHKTEEVANSLFPLLTEGVCWYGAASKQLSEFLSGSQDTDRRELASKLASAEELITLILHAPNEAVASQMAATLAELSAHQGEIKTSEVIEMAQAISDMKSRGIMLAKRAMQALAGAGDFEDMPQLVPLLSHESKEMREAAARTLILFTLSRAHEDEALYVLCGHLLNALSHGGGQNCEPILRVLKKGDFSGSLLRMFRENPEKFEEGRFDSNTYRSLKLFLFQNFEGIQKDIYGSLMSETPASAIGIYMLVFQHAPSTILLTEAMKISERLQKIASDKLLAMKTRKRAIDVLAAMPSHLTTSFRTNVLLDASCPDENMLFDGLHKYHDQAFQNMQQQTRQYSFVMLIIDPEPIFTGFVASHVNNILDDIGVSDTKIIQINNLGAIQDTIGMEHDKICCIVSSLPLISELEKNTPKGLVMLLKSLHISSPILFIRTEKGHTLKSLKHSLKIEQNETNCAVPLYIFDKDDFLAKDKLHSILGECGILNLKNGKPHVEEHTITDYLVNTLVNRKITELLGQTIEQLQSGSQIFVSCGCLYIRGKTEGLLNKTLLLVGPTRQTPDITLECANTIKITHLGSLNVNYANLQDGRHSARVIHGRDGPQGWLAKRSNSFSKGDTVELRPSGKPYRVSISNRTGEGAILLLVEESFIPSPQ